MSAEPSPARAEGRRGWSRDLADCLAVLVSPRRAYRDLTVRRPVLVPWLLAAVPSIVLSLLVISIAQRASVHLLQDLDDPALAAAVTQQLGALKAFAVLGAPLALLVRWTLLAALLWAAGTFTLRDASFRTMLAVVACAGLPDVFGKAVDLGVTWVDGPEFGPDLVPRPSSATGLAALLPAAGGTWTAALLDRLNPFALWTGALWTIGVQEAARASLPRALAVTAPAWLLTALAGAAMTLLHGSLAGLPGVPGG